ncbi:hypothetical protein [Nodularia sp. UHCC 0506]|nr:hypothetical protein [Nodularia sp. UHCC 0506]MEA5516171.1 hypothetical protein [Nodularia sp. UHCC 0506]
MYRQLRQFYLVLFFRLILSPNENIRETIGHVSSAIASSESARK